MEGVAAALAGPHIILQPPGFGQALRFIR